MQKCDNAKKNVNLRKFEIAKMPKRQIAKMLECEFVCVIQTPNIKHQTQTANYEYQTLRIVYQTSDTDHQTPNEKHHVRRIRKY